MIAKEIAGRRAGGSFRGLVTYITSGRGKAERVGRVRLTNCVSTDVGSAMLEVENTQACNRRAQRTTYHLMLAFPADEQPPAELLEAIERRACEALGFADHQRVSVVHHDTDHLHVHVAINRVHPTTHRVHWPSFSKLVLDRVCVEIEQEYGLQPVRHRTRERAAQLEAAENLRAAVRRDAAEALGQARSWAELNEVAAARGLGVQVRGNGLALVAADGLSVRASSVSRDLSKAALERRFGAFERAAGSTAAAEHEQGQPGSRRPPDIEPLAGVESLTGWVQRQCAEGLRQAQSWAELHDVAAGHGLRVQLRGSGLVFVAAEGMAVKASSVARDLSKAALERRLGAFQKAPPARGEVRATYEPRPLADPSDARLYDRYRDERETAFERRTRVVAQLRQQRARDGERLRQISKRRWAAIRLVAKGRVAWALWSSYAKQADRRDRDRARERHRAALRAAAAQHRRIGWLDWLRSRAAQADTEALASLRRRRAGDHLIRNVVRSDARARGPAPASVDSVTAAGTVIYRVPGGTIRDDGNQLHLAGSQSSQTAAEALLRLAHARYGARLGVDGDSAFREQIVRAAVNAGLPITFADERLERRRLDLQQLQGKEPADAEQRTRERSRQRPEPTRALARAGAITVAGRRGIPKPDSGAARGAPPAQAIAALRSVSELPVVRYGRAPEVLLPADARRHMEQRGAEGDRGVRRDPAQPGVEAQSGKATRSQR